jgi:hydroxymethylbilane synthase
MDSAPLRLGTRRSALALAQSGMIARRVAQVTGRAVELVEISTYGDVSTEQLAQIGGTGVFVSALRDALSAGVIDFAVHSLKDLPTQAPDGLDLVAVPEREDARDALVARDGVKFADLPPGASIGTGSPRRAAQVRMMREDVRVVPIRGNVDTRINLVTSGTVDAVVLALAGLSRLGRAGEVTECFDPSVMLPAPGQGALAIECRSGDALGELLARLDDDPTRVAVRAERALLAGLEAGCSAPVGGYATVTDGALHLTGIVADTTSPRSIRMSTTGPQDQAEQLGHDLAARLLAQGAAGFMGKQT